MKMQDLPSNRKKYLADLIAFTKNKISLKKKCMSVHVKKNNNITLTSEKSIGCDRLTESFPLTDCMITFV